MSLALLALASGCGGDDPVAPAALSGQWALASVEGELPKVIASSGFTTMYITSGMLDFRSRGRVLDIKSYLLVGLGGSAEVGPDTVGVAYEFAGERLILRRRYLDGRVFSDTGVVDLEVGGMLISARDVGPARDVYFMLLYRRI